MNEQNKLLTSQDVIDLGLSIISEKSDTPSESNSRKRSSDSSGSFIREVLDIKDIALKDHRFYVGNKEGFNIDTDDLLASQQSPNAEADKDKLIDYGGIDIILTKNKEISSNTNKSDKSDKSDEPSKKVNINNLKKAESIYGSLYFQVGIVCGTMGMLIGFFFFT